MKIGLRLVGFVFSAVLAAVLANSLAVYVNADACLDAGGRYEAATGVCNAVTGFVTPFSRPGNTSFWIVFLAPVIVVSAGAYVGVSRILGRIFRNAKSGSTSHG